MVICRVVFVLYTAHGGQSSVVRTDLVQFLIIIMGMILIFQAALNASRPGLHLSESFPTSENMGIEGIVAAALLAAFISSADTSLMTVSSILTHDISKKLRPKASSNHLIQVSRIAVLIIGASALLMI